MEGLLVDCLSARAQKEPLVFVLEDVHWIDPLSHDLLEILCKAIVNLPVLMVLVYRPTVVERLKKKRVSGLPYFNEVKSKTTTIQSYARTCQRTIFQGKGQGNNS